MAVLVGGWGLLSHFRHQNEDYLSYVFNKEAKTETDDTILTNGSIVVNLNELIIPKTKRYTSADFNGKAVSKANFKLPMSLYQVYMYVAFNYDNFNYNVFKIDRYSAGCKTLFPVFALTGIRFFVPALTNFPVHNYNTNFTTNPGIYNAYYDFGVLGVVLFMLFVGFLANTVSIKQGTESSIAGIIYNALMKYTLLFFFFTSFFSNATMGFYVILIALIHAAVSHSIEIKK
ncbi:MAG: oligosaccharide repeat unit polymerase [Bacillota bacterium]|nr:oligosaccharide repeat unit polymerase [Bacillota bacterium]